MLRSAPEVPQSRTDTVAITDLIKSVSECIGVRYSSVWLAWLTARHAAASSNGRMVSASRRACASAARAYQFQQL